MTKKHFIELADVLRDMRPSTDKDGSEDVPFEVIIETLADFCARQNPRFNRERWTGYINGQCGPNGGCIKKAA